MSCKDIANRNAQTPFLKPPVETLDVSEYLLYDVQNFGFTMATDSLDFLGLLLGTFGVRTPRMFDPIYPNMDWLENVAFAAIGLPFVLRPERATFLSSPQPKTQKCYTSHHLVSYS